ncbi:MAG: putative nucleotidyltransferase substrate binding domain-containing protein [Arcobacteraceae bacterium]|nr:putative nucleotidyltransferase substrate binding domain-containing protein [Arcobacteraceae bacterium]
MALLEEKSFIKKITPFNRLDDYELEKLIDTLDVVYFKENTVLLSSNEKPAFLYFIIKGVVQELQEDTVISVYGNNEYFDPISLIENHSKHSFKTTSETICYALPRETFLEIMYQNEELEGYFFQSISKKLNNSVGNEQSKEFVNLMIARVKDAYMQKPIIIDENETIFNTVQILKKNKASSILVKTNDGKMGIVTDTDFREKIVLNRIDFDAPISKIATWGLKTINQNEFLFNAQITMNKFGVKRLIVIDEVENIIGVLDLISLTSFFASQTYSVILEIDNTQNIEELKIASEKFVRVIRMLYAKGVKVRYIAKIISQLNNKLFKRLFELIAPEELKMQSALIIMGSEGREEQILRTDQDNALILSNDCTVSKEIIEEFTQNFTNNLIECGYPRCNGNIMVSNPFWVKTQDEFEETIFEWINNPSEENHMNLAIFYDAFAVAGDKYLLVNLKKYLFQKATDSSVFHSFFAKPVLNFETPIGMFANFIVDKKEHKDELDIKKGGIFPIVHGIRALSLEKKIRKTNTVHRIKELEELGVLDREFSMEIIESFNLLLTLRLKFRLEKIDSKEPLDNYINPNRLNSLEKDLLRDSFKIVEKFKKFISFHFKLNLM